MSFEIIEPGGRSRVFTYEDYLWYGEDIRQRHSFASAYYRLFEEYTKDYAAKVPRDFRTVAEAAGISEDDSMLVRAEKLRKAASADVLEYFHEAAMKIGGEIVKMLKESPYVDSWPQKRIPRPVYTHYREQAEDSKSAGMVDEYFLELDFVFAIPDISRQVRNKPQEEKTEFPYKRVCIISAAFMIMALFLLFFSNVVKIIPAALLVIGLSGIFKAFTETRRAVKRNMSRIKADNLISSIESNPEYIRLVRQRKEFNEIINAFVNAWPDV